MIYFIYLLLLFLCSMGHDFHKHSKKTQVERRWYLFSLVLIVLLVGLRYNIGGDTLVYSSNYPSFPKLGDANLFGSSRYQPGWIILEATFRSLTPNFVYIQFFVALFVNVVLFHFLWKNTDYPFLSLFVFYVVGFLEFDMEILRESVSICIGLIMFTRFQEGKYYQTLLLLLLAFSIHVSAVVLVVLLILSRIRLNKVSFLIAIITCFVGALLFQYKPEWSIFLDYLAYRDDRLVQTYFENYEVREMNLFGLISHFSKFLIVPSVSLFIASKNNNKTYSLICFGYMFFGALSFYSNAFLRASNYFAPFYWIVIAEAISYSYQEAHIFKSKFVLLVVATLLLGYFYEKRLFYEDNSYSGYTYVYEWYYPYKSVLESENTYLIINPK